MKSKGAKLHIFLTSRPTIGKNSLKIHEDQDPLSHKKSEWEKKSLFVPQDSPYRHCNIIYNFVLNFILLMYQVVDNSINYLINFKLISLSNT